MSRRTFLRRVVVLQLWIASRARGARLRLRIGSGRFPRISLVPFGLSYCTPADGAIPETHHVAPCFPGDRPGHVRGLAVGSDAAERAARNVAAGRVFARR